MKKIFALIPVLMFCVASQAQVVTAQATKNADGSQSLKVTDATGRVTQVSGTSTADVQRKYSSIIQAQGKNTTPEVQQQQQPQQVATTHVAVLKNGQQEISWTDAKGVKRVVTASPGESIQKKYVDYLQANGLPCGCSVQTQVSPNDGTHTATKN